MTRTKDKNIKDGKATGNAKSVKEGPSSLVDPREKIKKKQIVSTLASLKEDPDEDAVANSTEDLDSIAQHAAATHAAPASKNPLVGRSQSFNTSLSDEAEPAVKG